MTTNTTTTSNTIATAPAYRPPDPPVVGTQPVTQFESDMVNNPSLAPGTVMSPTLMQNDPSQELNASNYTINPTGVQASTAGAVATAGQATVAPSAAASQVDQNQFTKDANTYTESIVGNTNAAQATAAQGTVSNDSLATAAQGTITPDETVQGQYTKLMDFGAGDIPDWAKGAVTSAQASMAARGMGASSIAAGAITSALMGAALPIAQQDAGAFLQMALKNLDNQQAVNMQNANTRVQMAMANLNNEQQTALFNAQQKQTFLLSDQAAANAAKQFNAQSQNQTEEFFANLASTIATQNANRVDAMNQLAQTEANKIAVANAANTTEINNANATRLATLSQFNATLADQREQFNAKNAIAIDQSNVEWRRNINTANTAAINAANQTNVQNLFNLSSQAQANIWQQWRDEASWANTSQENALNRQANLAIASLQRQTAFDLNDQQSKDNLNQLIGSFAFNLLN